MHRGAKPRSLSLNTTRHSLVCRVVFRGTKDQLGDKCRSRGNQQFKSHLVERDAAHNMHVRHGGGMSDLEGAHV